MEKKDKLLKLQDLTMYFFICSFIGWLLEVAYAFSVYGTFVDRGFLRGPICPIYGYGAVIMVLITDWIKKKKITNLLIIFAIVAVIATVLEYIASYFLELVFNLRWWDYTGYFLNINGRVCLIFSIFGIAGVIFIKNIYPIMQKTFDKIRKKLSTKTIWIILITLIILMTLDKGISALLYIDPELKYVDRRVILQKFK